MRSETLPAAVVLHSNMDFGGGSVSVVTAIAEHPTAGILRGQATNLGPAPVTMAIQYNVDGNPGGSLCSALVLPGFTFDYFPGEGDLEDPGNWNCNVQVERTRFYSRTSQLQDAFHQTHALLTGEIPDPNTLCAPLAGDAATVIDNPSIEDRDGDGRPQLWGRERTYTIQANCLTTSQVTAGEKQWLTYEDDGQPAEGECAAAAGPLGEGPNNHEVHDEDQDGVPDVVTAWGNYTLSEECQLGFQESRQEHHGPDPDDQDPDNPAPPPLPDCTLIAGDLATVMDEPSVEDRDDDGRLQVWAQERTYRLQSNCIVTSEVTEPQRQWLPHEDDTNPDGLCSLLAGQRFEGPGGHQVTDDDNDGWPDVVTVWGNYTATLTCDLVFSESRREHHGPDPDDNDPNNPSVQDLVCIFFGGEHPCTITEAETVFVCGTHDRDEDKVLQFDACSGRAGIDSGGNASLREGPILFRVGDPDDHDPCIPVPCSVGLHDEPPGEGNETQGNETQEESLLQKARKTGDEQAVLLMFVALLVGVIAYSGRRRRG